MGRSGFLFLILAISVFSAGTAEAQLDLKVRIEGVEDDALRKDLRAASKIAQAEQGTYRALAPLRRAADSDARAIRTALASLGYYAGEVAADVDRDDNEAAVVFTVEPGPRFSITDYRIDYTDDVGAQRPQTLAEAGLKPKGDPTGDALRRLETGLISALWARGFPDAESQGRRVEADFDAGTATAVFPIESGPQAFFDGLTITGNDRTEEAYIAQLRTFERGQLYRRSDIDGYRQALAATGLFRDVSIRRGERGPDGKVELLVDVEERARRTLKVGVGYGTDIGPGVTAAWQNRNILGRGETLSIESFAAAPRQTLETIFTKPRPRLPGSYELSVLLENETTDAFTARSVSAGGSVLKFWLDRDLRTSIGVRGRYADIVELAEETEAVTTPAMGRVLRPIDDFSAISVPVSAIWDTADSELNPTTGFRLLTAAESFFVIDGTNFTKAQLGGASRYGFGEDKRTMIAGRFLLGATYGADRSQVPPTERYFAGGGGSVRGYGFQEAGPLNVVEGPDGALFLRDGTPLFDAMGQQRVQAGPIGGVSRAEANVEVRRFVTDEIQLAVFADAGTVFQSETPDFSGEFFVGVGAGVRYHTPIGPVRLDIALPLDRRVLEQTVPAFDDEGNPQFNDDGSREFTTVTPFKDDIIGIYIALGQPF